MDAVEKEKILKIVTAAAAAPSGDNSQPWRFVVRGRSLAFHYLPEHDHPILNYEESGTLIALGAAIQNAELEAQAQGYTPRTSFRETGSCVAVMDLEEGGSLDAFSQSLRDAIPNRHTNRKAYKKTPLTAAAKVAFQNFCTEQQGGLALAFIESFEAMGAVSRALTTMEETALGNKNLHGLFFGDIFWSSTDNRDGKKGLYIKTLELPPPAQAMFRLLKHWSFARVLAKIGFPKMVAKTNAVQNASAAAFGVITGTVSSRTVYLETGKLLERVWLYAVAQGLSLQIVTGITFLARSLRVPEVAQLFNPAEQQRIQNAYAIIKKNVDEGREPILIFRIGTGQPPTDVSYRRAPEVIFY